MAKAAAAGQTGVDAHDSAGIASNAAGLEAAGDSFVVQYIGIDPSTEDGGAAVTSAQVQTDLSAGLRIASIFETNSMSSTIFKTGMPTFGWEAYLTEAQGEADAAAAQQAAEAIGQPAGSAIYFAMDFDPAATDGTINEATALSRVNSYFAGVKEYFASVSSGSVYTIGVYGAGATLRSVSDAGLAQYTWLARSTGWDGYTIGEADGVTHGWSMIQSAASPFNGVPINQDTTETDNFGAWNSSVVTMPCFVMGTFILGTRGEVAVERLRPGDQVVLAGGGASPVVWIGHRRVDCRRHPRPEMVWPVRICTGAFADQRPHRDLLLSPDHAVFVDGVLIPVRCLINGATVEQQQPESVMYWHVELERHDAILAEALPCESFLDTGNRSAFTSRGAAVQMHPDFAQRVWEAKSFAPLVVCGPRLDAAKRHLMARAMARGHTGDHGEATAVVDSHATRIDACSVPTARRGDRSIARAMPGRATRANRRMVSA